MHMKSRILVLAVSTMLTLALMPGIALAEDGGLVIGSASLTAQSIGNYGVDVDSEYYSSSNPFQGFKGECTWYAWGRAYEKTGIQLGYRGNANSWISQAVSTPRANSVVVWTGGHSGHVAFVEAYDGNTIYISEYNRVYHQYSEGTIDLSTGLFTYTYGGSGSSYVDAPYGYTYCGDSGSSSSFESYVDDIHGVAGGICLRGWTFNRNNLTRSTQIHAYLDGGVGVSTTSWAIEANVARTDVDAVHHVGAYHGFDTTITGVPAGNHTIYLYANDQYLNQSQFIGSYSVSVPTSYNPEGWLDVATGGDGTVYVKGWALDRDDQNANLEVHVYIGGSGIDGEKHVLAANRSYPSVNSTLGVSGDHGFEATLQTSQRGSVPVYAHAVNIGGGNNGRLTQVCTATVLEPKRNAVAVAEGAYTIRSALDTSKALDVANASKDNLANVMLFTWNGGDNQKFALKAVGDGSYCIIAAHSNKAVEVTDASTVNGANVAQYTQNQTVAQRWFFDQSSDGTYTIRQRNSGLVMGVNGLQAANGTNISQYAYNGGDNQRFYLVPTDASKWSVSLPSGSEPYTGKAWEPAPTVVAGGVTMKQGVDYAVSYSNNVNAGTATVTVTGKGGYTGEAKATFAITSAASGDGQGGNASGDSQGGGPAGNGASGASRTDLATYAGAAKAAGFTDLVASEWYMRVGKGLGSFDNSNTLYLDYTVGRKLMTGTDSIHFDPNGRVSRAMVAMVLFRLGNPGAENGADANETGLRDVAGGQWYTRAVNWCFKNGVVTGYKDANGNPYEFRPDAPVSREEMALMYARYCWAKGGMQPVGTADAEAFPDYADISGWAREGVAFCKAKGVISGKSDTGRFDPHGNSQRCEMAKVVAVVARMLG